MIDLDEMYARVQYDAESAGDGYAWSVSGTLETIRDELKKVIPEQLVVALADCKKAIVCPDDKTALGVVMALMGTGFNFAVVNDNKTVIVDEAAMHALRVRGVNV